MASVRSPDGHRPGTPNGHGDSQTPDPFAWLEQPDTPQTRAWLDMRSQEFTAHAKTWNLRPWLSAEIHRLLAHDDHSIPHVRADTVLATHRPSGAEHPRVVATRAGCSWVVFDPMKVDPTGRTTLDAWEASPDGRLVAVQTSRDGTELGQLEVLDVATGERMEPPITGIRYSHVAWLADHHSHGPAFYYVRRDGNTGQRGVWLHTVTPQREFHPDGRDPTDVLIRPCTVAGAVPGVRIERGRWLIVSESHGTGYREDLWIADLAAAQSPAHAPDFREIHADVDVVSEARVGPDGWLYLRTSLTASRRRVCRVDPNQPGVANWREVVAEDTRSTLDAFAVRSTAEGQPELLLARTWLGISSLCSVSAADGRQLRRLPLPGEGMITRMEVSPGTGSPRGDHAPEPLWVAFSGVATPHRVLCYSRDTEHDRGWRPWPRRQTRTPGPPIRRQVHWFRSFDDTAVPVTILSAHPFDTRRPTILHAYGAYGRPRQFGFSATVLAWLRTGGQYAVAHVRGGGDLGREWHLAGAHRAKPTSVEDLLHATDAITAAGYCTRDQLCLSGGSAGGLVVLAAMARRPDCCRAVLASAPLTDMLNFERMGMGALWTREFGTASNPADRTVLASYSPYHQVVAQPRQNYPAVLLTGFHGDTRTDAAHARKMCAALGAASAAAAAAPSPSTGARPALLRYEYGVGHGPRALSRAVDLAADAHAFVAAWTGLALPSLGYGKQSGAAKEGGVQPMDPKETVEIPVEVEDLPSVTSRDTTAGGDTDGKDSSSDFI
ncbi:prolyl oligopeptidase family serine peptidase [Lipingzhangella sp. LS1_29]|uniref:prolyl oligopeptidase n=1 Tax=Lipingzhangella rawalii TaxID=2055835 RepID=A0ABU2H302_9ACTN|nr:prolyl oligopeptidase family serine peptidase [Lipingzhangella rawalii]MDS1269229.1 prolyl oligopeptidase family serine peptidase [Lipingzhangella rawalii]